VACPDALSALKWLGKGGHSPISDTPQKHSSNSKERRRAASLSSLPSGAGPWRRMGGGDVIHGFEENRRTS